MTATNTRDGAWIPNAPFRERALVLLERGDTLSEMACRADMVSRDGSPETTRVARALGLKPDAYTSRPGGRRYGEGRVRTHVTEETALKLCRALDLDPWEVGF